MRHAYASMIFAILLASGLISGCAPSGRGGGGPNPNSLCPANCTSCTAQGACQDCTPNQNTCQGDSVAACNPDGTIGGQVKVCDTANNQRCAGGDCLSPCDVAASTHSYIGCDYWPVTTVNAQLNSDFDFAVAVANPLSVGDVVQSAKANVTVSRGGKTIASVTVDPGSVEIIKLPWVFEISQNQGGGLMKGETSVLLSNGAYHLVSNLPVTVYQFNPLEFEKPQSNTCMDPPRQCLSDKDCLNGDKCDQLMFQCQTSTCHSYSNDASILLPTTALTTEYIVVARQTFALIQQNPNTGQSMATAIPGFFAVVATEDNTTVNVVYSANIEPGNGVGAAKPGQMVSYSLAKGEVLEVVSQRATSPCVNMAMDMAASYCDLGPKYDLTGTHITADKPIAVFGGHSCTFTPYNKWACDHIEEQMTPLSTWGQKIIVAQTKPQIKGEPNVWRIISGSDGNKLTFDPAVYKPTTLNKSQYVEFIAQGGFQVTGTGHTAVGQYMVGENYVDNSSIQVGDPSLGLGVPVEQFRDNYDFISPSTYTKNYVTVIGPMAATITLDTHPVNNGFSAIGGSGYGYQYIELMPGAHHITGSAKFGITVSGIANFTSYLYVGGQNLNDVPLQ